MLTTTPASTTMTKKFYMPDPSVIMQKEIENDQSNADQWIQRICDLSKYMDYKTPVIEVTQDIDDNYTYDEQNINIYKKLREEKQDLVKILPTLNSRTLIMISDFIKQTNTDQLRQNSTHDYSLSFRDARQSQILQVGICRIT